MPGKTLFTTVALIPILVPSLLPGLALVYLFGNQGLVKGLLPVRERMATVSGVVFLYGPSTELASVAVLNMDDTGDVAAAAAAIR